MVTSPMTKIAGITVATNGMNASGDCDAKPSPTSELDSATEVDRGARRLLADGDARRRLQDEMLGRQRLHESRLPLLLVHDTAPRKGRGRDVGRNSAERVLRLLPGGDR